MGERTKATSSLPKPNPRLRRVKPEPESTTLEEGKRGGGREKKRISSTRFMIKLLHTLESSLKRGWRTQKKIKGVDAFGDGGYKWVYEDKIRRKKKS